MGRKPNEKNHKLKSLSKFLKDKLHVDFARSVKISCTHLSLILSGHRKPSLPLVVRMSQATDGALNIKNMRPDIHIEIMKHAEVEKV